MAQEVFIKNREEAIEELRQWQKSDDEEVEEKKEGKV